MTHNILEKRTAHGCEYNYVRVLTTLSRVIAILLLCLLTSSITYGQRVVKRQQQSKPATQGSTGTVKKNPQATVTTGEYVDLGLPSGTLWATKNIGANKPEEYGDYFAWGETKPKKEYTWETYKWCNGTSDYMTKYNNNETYGTVDNKSELDLEDDAAYVNRGNSWRMPSNEQFEELVRNCNWTRTRYKGVYGYMIKGKNGKSIFLPSGGKGDDTEQERKSSGFGFYWTRNAPTKQWWNINPEGMAYLYWLYVNNGIGENIFSRFRGLNIRPVRNK